MSDITDDDPPPPKEPGTVEEWLRRIDRDTFVTRMWVQSFGIVLLILMLVILFGGHVSCRAG